MAHRLLFHPILAIVLVALSAFGSYNLVSARPTNAAGLVSRGPTDPVYLLSFAYNCGTKTLNGTIQVQNIAFQKTVTVYYSDQNNAWVNTNTITASYLSGPVNNFEIWSFSGVIKTSGISQFYVRYDVNSATYYDNNGGYGTNYKVATCPTTSSALPATTATTPSPTTTTKSTTTTTTATTTTTTTTQIPTPTTTTTTATTTAIPASTVAGSPTATTTDPSATNYVRPAYNRPAELPSCQVFTNISCATSADLSYPSSFENRRWQTPPRSDSSWRSTYGDFGELQGYASVTYAADRKSATITFNAYLRVSGGTSSGVVYSFNGGAYSSVNTASVTLTFTGPFTVKARAVSVNAVLELDPLYFFWDLPAINRAETLNGQKGAIVELFGWPYADVAKECAFLGAAGYMGVKVWAPNEHLTSDVWLDSNNMNPWYWTYQPVSYRFKSRHGSMDDMRNMIVTCRRSGVRVYADAVVNHMTGNSNDVLYHRRAGSATTCSAVWGPKNGTAGSPFYTSGNTYTFNGYTADGTPALEFPAVPYGPTHFHCERTLSSYTDPVQLNAGWLVGLTDLNTELDYVQERIATYMESLLSVGFSGFRIDAAKHIQPLDIAAILKKLQVKMGGSFTPEFITWLEVIMGGEKDLLACNSASDYNFYTGLDSKMAAAGLSTADIAKVKIWSSDYPKEFPICGSWVLPSERFVVQNDDHDQQNSGSSSRDMGDTGSVLIKDKDVSKHRSFEVKLFTRTDANWQIRNILSSWSFTAAGAVGFPDGQSSCANYKGTQTGCLDVPYRPAFVSNSCGYSVQGSSGWIYGEYTRVHRDLSIVNAMRGWMGLASVTATQVGLPSTCT